jgi:hypothetical protein
LFTTTAHGIHLFAFAVFHPKFHVPWLLPIY